MCGIVGIIEPAKDWQACQLAVRQMLRAVQHRGPDQFGIYQYQTEARHVCLGHARLSILDLAGGQQPIGTEDCSKWIVFNGEIFNFQELRRDLAARGHRFQTQTDTEVVLHLYEEYGPDCVLHLNGQYAFAIWDETEEGLFLARDPLGILPLYYTQQQQRLAFASEIKAILADHRNAAHLDRIALDQVFTFWSALPPRTIVQEIRSVPPGYRGVLRAGDGELQLEKYWSLSFPAKGRERRLDLVPAAAELRELLDDATRIRLRADVTVGCYLSGGVDSSFITALALRTAGHQLETFSVAFTEAEFDERVQQQEVARYLGTRHHVVYCSPGDIGEIFPLVVRYAESPLLRTAPAPLFLLSRLVRQSGIKAVLTGEGADEFLGGYDIFKEAKIRNFWARQPGSKWRKALLTQLYAYIHGLRQSNAEFLEQYFGQGLLERSDYFSHLIRWRGTARLKRFFAAGFTTEVARQARGDNGCGENGWGAPSLPPEFSSWSKLAQAQYLEATIFLPGYLLSSQGDRMLMAHGVEGRFPFLDPRLIEFCNQLSPRLKMRGIHEKAVLKRAAADLVPPAIIARVKQPYRAPVQNCFFISGRPREWVADICSPASLESAGCFEPRAVEGLLRKAARTAAISEMDGMALAGILSTQLLIREWFEKPSTWPSFADATRIKVIDRLRGLSERSA